MHLERLTSSVMREAISPSLAYLLAHVFRPCMVLHKSMQHGFTFFFYSASAGLSSVGIGAGAGVCK
jgi:hypothetical protein